MPITIRLMGTGDVAALVSLHAQVFPSYNSTLLGRAYLSALYGTLAQSPACLSTVATDGDRIAGWVGGVLDYPQYHIDLTRRSWYRLPAIVINALRRKPSLIGAGARLYARAIVNKAHTLWGDVSKRFLSRANYGGPQRQETTATVPTPTAHLLVIGVAPGLQSRGLGQGIMADFHHRVRALGYAAVSLTTFADNAAANRAFQKAGYQLVSSQGGTNRYCKYLTE